LTADPHAAYARVLADLRLEPSRSWSIIISFFGDAIMPRGGLVWLGTISAFCKGLDIGEGAVRTAMSRLTADDWLERRKVGRNSFYALAERGETAFAEAAQLIYNPRLRPWNGRFTLVWSETPEQSQILSAAGFGSPSPGLFIAPAGTKLPPGISLTLTGEGDIAMLRALASRAWALSTTAQAYRRFIDRFQPLRVAPVEALPDLEAMVARVLLIHDYRRILLRDPLLPAEILPPDWAGTEARGLCADLYPRLLAGSERWLDGIAIDASGAPLNGDPAIHQRFRTR
jgi:phenylacetic acid degradation operon negative regulatory protein